MPKPSVPDSDIEVAEWILVHPLYLIGFPYATSFLAMYGEHGLFLQWSLYPADVLREITMVASAAKQALFTE